MCVSAPASNNRHSRTSSSPTEALDGGFPLVLIDCLIAGRPVLATDVGEIEYMLRGKKGLAGDLVGLNDWEIPIDDLAAKIAKAATDRDYYDAMMAAIAPAMEKFDLELMLDKYTTIYRRLTAHRDADG